MFTTGWAAPRRRSACRTADVLALKSHNLDATTFWSAPRISATPPSGIADLFNDGQALKFHVKFTIAELTYSELSNQLVALFLRIQAVDAQCARVKGVSALCPNIFQTERKLYARNSSVYSMAYQILVGCSSVVKTR